jgi:hypothetical protein
MRQRMVEGRQGTGSPRDGQSAGSRYDCGSQPVVPPRAAVRQPIVGLLNLQRSVGNSAVAGLLAKAAIASAGAEDRSVQRQAKVHLVDVEEFGPPPAEGVQLPTVDPKVSLVDDDAGESREVRLSEIRKSQQYVDNGIETIQARPDVWTLQVEEMELIYGNGQRLMVLLNQINHDAGQRAAEYVRRGGLIWPLGPSGSATFDIENTPNVVASADWIYEEIGRRHAERVEMAELIVTFASAIAALGGVASMGRGSSQVRPTSRGLPIRQTGPGGPRNPKINSLKARVRELASDPALGGKYSHETLREADVALRMEGRGQLTGPVRRASDPRADFVDGLGQRWDVKRLKGSGGPAAQESIKAELTLGENVILDTRSLTPAAIDRLQMAADAKGWGPRVLFYP